MANKKKNEITEISAFSQVLKKLGISAVTAFYVFLGFVTLVLVLLAKSSMPGYNYWSNIVPKLLLVALWGYFIFILFSRDGEMHITRFAGLMVVFCIFLYFPLLNRFYSIIGDNCRYVGSAYGLSQGKGLVNVFWKTPRIQTVYGFGLPALLLPGIWWFGGNVVALKVPIVVSGILGILFGFLLIKEYLGAKGAMLVCLLTSVNPYIISSMDQIMTEIPFYGFSIMSLYMILRYTRQKAIINRWYFLTVISVSFTYHIKTVGVVIIIALGIQLLLLKQWKKALLVMAGIFILVFPWVVRNSIHVSNLKAQGESAPTYVDTYVNIFKGKDHYNTGAATGFATVGKGIIKNIKTVFGAGFKRQALWSTDIVLGGKDGPRCFFACVLMLAGLFIQLYKHFRYDREKLIIHIYFGGIFMLYLLVGLTMAPRYLTIMTPFYFLYFIYSIGFLLNLILARSTVRHKDRIRSGILAGIALILFLPDFSLAAKTIRYKRMQQGYGGAWGNYYEAAQWAAHNAGKLQEPIVSRKAELIYPWTGQYAVNYPITAQPDSMLAFLRDHEYILLDNGLGFRTTQMYVYPVIKNNMDKFRVVYRTRRQPYQYVVKVLRKE